MNISLFYAYSVPPLFIKYYELSVRALHKICAEFAQQHNDFRTYHRIRHFFQNIIIANYNIPLLSHHKHSIIQILFLRVTRRDVQATGGNAIVTITLRGGRNSDLRYHRRRDIKSPLTCIRMTAFLCLRKLFISKFLIISMYNDIL